MHTSFVALLTFLAVFASVLGAPNVVRWGGSLEVRQSTPDSNATMYPEACGIECRSIDQVLANCGMDIACRCTEENAGHLSNCMNCFVANIDTTFNPVIVQAAEATLERFNRQCATASHPLRMTFSVTATGSAMPVATSTRPEVHDSPDNTSSHRMLQGAIAGGVLGGVTLFAIFVWLFFRHRKAAGHGSNLTFTGKERPFHRLEEPDGAKSVTRPTPAMVRMV